MMNELERSMMSQHVIECWSPLRWCQRGPRTFFGISYSKMYKYSHTTLLEYEGKKQVDKRRADDETGATEYWCTRRCHCRPLQARDTSLPLSTFTIRLLFITVYLKKYCLRSSKGRKHVHKQRHTHVNQLLYFINLKYWRLHGPIQVHHCLILRYFMELWILRCSFVCCFVVFQVLQLNRVMNSKHSGPH